MKNRAITGISAGILGLLIAFIPSFILPVGLNCQRLMMECVAAAKTEYGIGILIVFLAILMVFAESRQIRIGISVALGFIGILASLFATVLLGFCGGGCSQVCSCNPNIGPVVAVLGILTAGISFVNAFYLSRSQNA